ncbi:E3 ubiquitin-protein ligase TRIM39-like [Embiotoca jacksoni]|uniref:E3 ubiquitin-protein ligase TRIM39-like n=1 Tax=Embiotoca jacksoni TaxID=100190 RepID=UPI0037049E9B
MSPTIRPVYSGATRAVLCVFLLSGLHYRFINQLKNWHEAQKHCREHFVDLATVDNMEDMERLIAAAGSGFSGQKHTDLASVRSEEERAAIQGVVPHDKLVAIGLWRPTWVWWSDRTQHNFKYWQDGRPTARSGNCAASVINATSHGKWIENHCNIELPFMCYDNSKQVLRIKLTALESTIDLNDPAVTAAILNLYTDKSKVYSHLSKTSVYLPVRNAASVPVEHQFRCCICLDVYTDPVSIPCGHNFCLDCIEGFWDTKETSDCPLCKETFNTRPALRINRGFSDVIEFFKRSLSPTPTQEEDAEVAEPPENVKQLPNQLPEAEEVLCDVCHRNKSASVKSCLVCQASYCEIHLTPHLRDPALQRHRLTDPATFAASHLCRNHNEPLTMFCKQDHTPVCDKCTKREHRNHQIVPMERESRRIKANLRETKADIQQMIQVRLRKRADIQSSVDSSKEITERAIQSGSQVCSMLIGAVKRQQAGLVVELEERQREAERRAEELLDELERETEDLQTRSSELQHLEITQSPLHLLQSFPSLSSLPSTRDWPEVAVHSDNCVGAVRRAVAKLVDVCQEAVHKLSAEEADKMNQYAVDVTLDPETASGWLVLSPDRKKVSLTCQKTKAPLPDNPERFDSCVCALGKQSFSSGRRYWVVQVGNKTDWVVGVARESIDRKGAITLRPGSGYWAICRRKGGSVSACAGPSVALLLPETPQKVGIFLDYEKGSVSFYDAEAKTHIYTYSGCAFSEPLYPYFNPCVQHDGKNATPLVICPLERSARD